MAEFIGRNKMARLNLGPDQGFAAMGKSIPLDCRQKALDHCKTMGLTDPDDAFTCVQRMSNHLERDHPYEAMEVGSEYLDLTGVYRLMAVLLTSPSP